MGRSNLSGICRIDASVEGAIGREQEICRRYPRVRNWKNISAADSKKAAIHHIARINNPELSTSFTIWKVKSAAEAFASALLAALDS